MNITPPATPIRPRCYNRAPFVDPHAGWRDTGRTAARVIPTGVCYERIDKPVYRYRWPWFDDRCATWSGTGIGQPMEEYPTGTPYPIAHGWDCNGCRLKP